MQLILLHCDFVEYFREEKNSGDNVQSFKVKVGKT